LEERGKRKIKTGVVVSDKMNKTAVVEIERKFRHPLFQKIVRVSKKFKIHDENNDCKVGDLVEIMETRRLSRDKHWRLVKIIGKSRVKGHVLPKKPVTKETEEVA
jgi:small subunit ribosomal protein S17